MQSYFYFKGTFNKRKENMTFVLSVFPESWSYPFPTVLVIPNAHTHTHTLNTSETFEPSQTVHIISLDKHTV